MTTTPRGSPELAAAQATPETTVNEQIRRTEGGAGRFTIADRVTAPPGSCADGAQYIIIATATGEFTGKTNQIAQAVGTNAASGWLYRTLGTLDEGVLAYVQDEDVDYKWSGSAWAVSTVVSFATASDIRTGTDSTKAIASDQLAASAAPQTLTDGATINWNMASGYNAKVTLGGNRTLATPTNPIVGFTYSLRVIQDGTGSRTLTWPGAFDWGTAGSPTLTTTLNKADRITLFCTDAATPKFDAFLSGKGFG